MAHKYLIDLTEAEGFEAPFHLLYLNLFPQPALHQQTQMAYIRRDRGRLGQEPFLPEIGE